MAFGATFENDLVKLIFTATAIANIADNAATSPLTNLYLALHTASPGSGGTQSTNEAAYPSYARQAVARTSGGWTVSTNVATLAATTSFPAATGTPSETETFASIGVAVSGATKVITFAALSANIVVNAAGITPQLTTATTFTLT
jgi:hypothetical protein